VFFDLKDEEQDAILPTFMMLFKQNIPLEDGMRVSVTCRPAIHPRTGKFSLNIDHIEAKGEGSLKRAFELLKQKLGAEGLFHDSRKRVLPTYPSSVGVISSEGAAGFGDFMRIAGQRLPGVAFTLAHVAVQGVNAESDIVYAFDYLNSHYELDVIVLIRGGGSMEDLHAFNSEPVARAITRSKVPVLVGVGHEQDVTIADFVADVRAATPSNAAQLLLPTKEEVWELVENRVQRGQYLVSVRLQDITQRTSYAVERMHQHITIHIQQVLTYTNHMIEKTGSKVASRIESLLVYTAQLARTVTAVSPQATLQRGYSIARTTGGKVVRSGHDVQKGDMIITQLATDSLTSIIQ
jgi:exodeoxyribonuclease VII large subunit